MRLEDMLQRVRAKPFVPFRIRLNSGRTFEIRHPEMIRLSRTTAHIYSHTPEPDVYEKLEMIGLLLIESIEPLEAPRAV